MSCAPMSIRCIGSCTRLSCVQLSPCLYHCSFWQLPSLAAYIINHHPAILAYDGTHTPPLRRYPARRSPTQTKKQFNYPIPSIYVPLISSYGKIAPRQDHPIAQSLKHHLKKPRYPMIFPMSLGSSIPVYRHYP